MRILLLTRYNKLGSSSRIRFLQYLPYLRQNGLEFTVCPFFTDTYLLRRYSAQNTLITTFSSYLRRFFSIFQTMNHNCIWLEGEMLPWLPSMFEKTLCVGKNPLIVDYDDALFHRYDQHPSALIRKLLGKKIDRIMAMADRVVVGNDYLADRAVLAGADRIDIIPSTVDIQRYTSRISTSKQSLVVGWIGSPATGQFLQTIKNPLRQVVSTSHCQVVAIGAKPDQITNLPVVAHPWSEKTEVQDLQGIDIGIMPLPDEPFTRGKCGFKLIQYMACGKPVVAHPVGMNREIIEHGVNGFLADSEDEWFEYLSLLLSDSHLRQTMGQAGRKLVETKYSLQAQAPRLLAAIRSVIH